MRWHVSLVTTLLAAAITGLAGAELPEPLARARDAVGGTARLAAVKAFTVSGRTRQLRGETLVSMEFEIACELPSRCVRREEIPARESGVTVSGFDGARLLLPAPAPRTAKVATVRHEFARLVLAFFGGAVTIDPT